MIREFLSLLLSPGIILRLLALMLPAHTRRLKIEWSHLMINRRVQLFCSLFNIFSFQSLITVLDKILEFCNPAQKLDWMYSISTLHSAP